MRRGTWAALAVTSAMASVPAGAQTGGEALLATLNACKAVPEAAARLACYDAALGRTAAPPAAVAAPAAVAPAPAPAAVAVVPRAVAPAAAPAATRAEDFGLNQPRPETVLQQIESRIVGRFEGWEPGTRWALANGQVWEVADNSRAAYELNAPAVRVKRGMLGSFFMEIDGVQATPRVRRVK